MVVNRRVLIPFLVIGFLSCTFVNDYYILGKIPAFYICWLFTIIIRSVYVKKISKSEFILQLVAFLTVIPILFTEMEQGKDGYFHAYIYIVLYINIIFTLPIIINNYRETFLTSVIILFILTLFALTSISSGDARTTIIFGPNVLYRLFSCLFGLILVTYTITHRRRINIYFYSALIILFIICMISTRSRGAMLTLILIFAYMIFNSSLFKLKLKFYLLSAPFLVVLSYYSYMAFKEKLWRLLYYENLTGENVRTEFFSNTIDFIQNENFSSLLWGLSSDNKYFQFYPHNIFLEALVYSGIYFLSFTILSYIFFFYTIVKQPKNTMQPILFISIFAGSLVSGGLFYNFMVYSIGITLLSILISKKTRKHFEIISTNGLG